MFKEKQFVFTNAWEIAKFYEKSMQNAGKQYGFTQCEMDVLVFLYANKPMNTSKDIAKYKSISKSLICKSVSSLLKKGFITSKGDEFDSRVLRLYLTPSGEQMANNIFQYCDALSKNLFWGISDSELQFLAGTQSRIIENGRKHYG